VLDATLLEERLVKVIAAVSGVPTGCIRSESRLGAHLDYDSFDVYETIFFLEDEFNIEVDSEEFEGVKTVQDLINLVKRHLDE